MPFLTARMNSRLPRTSLGMLCSSLIDKYIEQQAPSILEASPMSTFDLVVPHHTRIAMFEIVAVIKECPRIILEADKYLDPFARHN